MRLSLYSVLDLPPVPCCSQQHNWGPVSQSSVTLTCYLATLSGGFDHDLFDSDVENKLSFLRRRQIYDVQQNSGSKNFPFVLITKARLAMMWQHTLCLAVTAQIKYTTNRNEA